MQISCISGYNALAALRTNSYAVALSLTYLHFSNHRNLSSTISGRQRSDLLQTLVTLLKPYRFSIGMSF